MMVTALRIAQACSHSGSSWSLARKKKKKKGGGIKMGEGQIKKTELRDTDHQNLLDCGFQHPGVEPVFDVL
jgi:hypothetical protein